MYSTLAQAHIAAADAAGVTLARLAIIDAR